MKIEVNSSSVTYRIEITETNIALVFVSFDSAYKESVMFLARMYAQLISSELISRVMPVAFPAFVFSLIVTKLVEYFWGKIAVAGVIFSEMVASGFVVFFVTEPHTGVVIVLISAFVGSMASILVPIQLITEMSDEDDDRPAIK